MVLGEATNKEVDIVHAVVELEGGEGWYEGMFFVAHFCYHTTRTSSSFFATSGFEGQIWMNEVTGGRPTARRTVL